MARRALVTGATGFVGGRLAALAERGWEVRCLVRDRSRTQRLADRGFDLMADALGVRRRPRLPVPLITPRLSSLWIGLVTPVDAGIARPLVEGLSTPTIVTDSSGAALFDIHPMPLMDALRRALAEDHDAPAPAM